MLKKKTQLSGKIPALIILSLLLNLILPVSAAADANTAPVLNDTGTSFAAINEDDTGNTGMTVLDLLSGKAADAEGNPLGIAVISADTANGTWQYKVGATWWTLPRTNEPLSEQSALLLTHDTAIAFQPGSDFHGTASLTFRVWDETAGTNESRADVTANGGSTPYSAGVGTATVTVNPVNDAPQILKKSGNSVLQFDGANDYLLAPDTNLTGSFTVEAWVNADAANTFSRIFDFGVPKGSHDGDNNIWAGFEADTGKMKFEVWDGIERSDVTYFFTTEVFPLHTWVYVSVVFDQPNSMGYIYWNGALKGSGPLVLSPGNTVHRTDAFFGKSNWTQDRFFDGAMHDISVWNDKRSLQEIRSDMNTVFDGNESNLVLYYPLNDERTASTIHSATGSSFDGALKDGLALADAGGFNYQVSGFSGSDIAVDGLCLKDVDAGTNSVALSLSAAHGTLTFGEPDGLDFTAETNGSGSFTARGTVQDLNSALETLEYRSDAGYTGTDSIDAGVTDLGNSGSGGALADAKTVYVVVNPSLASISPTIDTQPADKTVNEGETAGFTLSATPPSGKTISYRWQKSTDHGHTWADIPGASGASYTTAAVYYADNGTEYRCIVSNLADNTSVTSNEVSLTVIDTNPPVLSNVTAVAAFGDGISATGSEAGTLYLVPKTGTIYTTKAALDNAAGVIKADCAANTPKALNASGCTTGFYQVYAVDQSGNVSAASADIEYAGGTGADDDPYEIPSKAVLFRLAEKVNAGEAYSGKYFVQTRDIDLQSEAWTPIGYFMGSGGGNGTYAAGGFQGIYDGRDFTISNLKVTTPTQPGGANTRHPSGLFGMVKSPSRIENVHLAGVEISTTAANSNYLGALIGEGCSTVLNCSAAGGAGIGVNPGGTASCAGGLIGQTWTGSNIVNCYTGLPVSNADGFAGGLIGCIGDHTLVVNCYSRGDVTCLDGGGFAGVNYGSISNCYSTGTANGAHRPMCLNTANGAFAVIADSAYYLSVAEGETVPGYAGKGATESAMKSEPFVQTLNINRACAAGLVPSGIVLYDWKREPGTNGGFPYLARPDAHDVTIGIAADPNDGYGGGSGTEGDPYRISTAEDLIQFMVNVNSGALNTAGLYFKLTADIVLGGGVWTPVGLTDGTAFAGSFDFNGHTVSGFTVNSRTGISGGYGGLFGRFTGSGAVAGYNVTISGSSGLAGAVLTYGNGERVTADSAGHYSITVPYGWTGTVTPAMAGYVFTPVNRRYTGISADQAGQDYTAALAPPAITTGAAADITVSGATLSGSVSSGGFLQIDERGFVWSTSGNPAIGGAGVAKAAAGSGEGGFTAVLTGLLPGTSYYVRVYATSGGVVYYGEEMRFTTATVTIPGKTVPGVETNEISGVSASGAILFGNVTSDGGSEVTERGFVYGTGINPAIGGKGVKKAAAGNGAGRFTKTLKNLEPDTTYHVRAYAVNGEGTGYGRDVSFTTASDPDDDLDDVPDTGDRTGGIPTAAGCLAEALLAGAVVLAYWRKKA
jgi:hypothetical protein